ncbi:MAG: alpha/beta hydrolase [Thermoanaerobaculia bacterium]|nr:alpha/beta hydrolase [Thermoanaerobaculia bacterium]
MPYIDRDGVAIWFEARGDGPPLLLSHGYSATGVMWEGQVEALRDRYRVITWDMRGHGRSDYPEDPDAYSEAATVGDMAAILDECEAPAAAIGGLSLGGYMSLAFHFAHPERTRCLLLFDTGPGYKSDEGRAEWNRTSLARADDLESRGFDALSSSREVRSRNHRSPLGLSRAARGMLAQKDDRIIQSLPGIGVPTLVVVGADDTPFLGASAYMAKKIEGARQVVLPDAGHASNLDQPEAFNAAMVEFLSSLPT